MPKSSTIHDPKESSFDLLKPPHPSHEKRAFRALCAVDKSKPSKYALRHAVTFAKATESAPAVFAVTAVDEIVGPAGSAISDWERYHLAEYALKAREVLDEAVMSLGPDRLAGVVVHKNSFAGRPVECILAASEFVDLVVVGTHARTGLKHLLKGSFAEQLVRHSNTPTLVVKIPSPELVRDVEDIPNARPIKRVLCPVDASRVKGEDSLLAPGEELVRACAFYSDILQADEVVLYHVLGWEGPTGQEMAIGHDILAHYQKVFTAAAPQIKVTAELSNSKNVGDKILAKAEEFDLVVLATHGHEGFDRLRMGSTCEHLMHHARCPILVVATGKDHPLRKEQLQHFHVRNLF